MAKLTSASSLTGTHDNLTAYRPPGVDGIVVRRKGGVAGHIIKSAPNYENTRRNNTEFKGRSIASGWIMRMMHPVKRLADHSIGGQLNALLKPVQELDTESRLGERNVVLSRSKDLLQGYSLNNNFPFHYVVRTPPACTVSREELSATIRIPQLLPQVNFYPSPIAPVFSIMACLGVVPNLFHSSGSYTSHDDYHKVGPVVATSPWYSCAEGCGHFDLNLRIPTPLPDQNFTLILSAGVCYGDLMSSNTIRQRKKSGCGAILAVV